MSIVENSPETPKILEAAFSERGLQFFGCVELGNEPAFLHFKKWLGEGKHGSMKFLENHLELREKPQELFDGAQSAVIFGLPYFQDKHKDSESLMQPTSKIASYARLKDYHRVMRKLGTQVLDRLAEHPTLSGIRGRVVVDSAPILERALAARSKRGFIGKNTCFILPKLGSFFLLGEIFVDRKLEFDIPASVDPAIRSSDGGCGTCRRCQIKCPTGALSEDYVLDANRCLSYWSIEHRGTVPQEFWKHFSRFWFGCDICQSVCPYNRGLKESESTRNLANNQNPPLAAVATMSEQDYEIWFGGTPMTRAKREGLQRNALIALWALGDSNLKSIVDEIINSSEKFHSVVLETAQQLKRNMLVSID